MQPADMSTATPISDTPPPAQQPPRTPRYLQRRPPSLLSASNPPPPPSVHNHQQQQPPSSARSSRHRRHSLPFFSYPLVSQPNVSSTSLVPSTAEGKPIPLDDSTAADRTTALRELNRSQPSSRHRYTKSTGAPSTATRTTTGTYSQPVIVRTYTGPPPSAISSRPASRRIPLSSTAASSQASNWRPGRNGMVLNMARHRGTKKAQSRNDVKLPPLEAFSFKNIMADIQQDIGADLDRIAEICARSKYSLSNQYEVHVVPHGSGTGFLSSASGSSAARAAQAPVGPTLQAIPSDDEQSTTRQKKRRSAAARRKSAAHSTLETIMSSSRSSEEDKSKKKSAQELTDSVRGRASRKRKGDDGDGSASSHSGEEEPPVSSPGNADNRKSVSRRKSSSFATAVMDSTRQNQGGEGTSPRASGAALVGEPAKPETSHSHLEIRTSQEHGTDGHPPEAAAEPSRAVLSASVAAADITSPEEPRGQSRLLAGFSSWMPWRGSAVTEVASSDVKGGVKSKSYAEGTLRELLRSSEASPSDTKGKGVGGDSCQ
ncbi:hypothetical protein PGQ11_012801 [Apiospora arundinis]|uniref:Uncharacterized protein n=1 Tax=Apiospora arundinis TaxID=335852 RepID=A0ABR2I3B3_9PEZI